jgi:hypothetical protein
MGVAVYVLLLAHPLLLASRFFELDLDTVWAYSNSRYTCKYIQYITNCN